MRIKGIIPTVVALSAIIRLMSFSAHAEELFSGVYTAKELIFSKDEGVRLEVRVPDGDYTVHVKTGGAEATEANVYINGGERVKEYTLEPGEMRDNELPAVPEEGKISVLVTGDAPNVTEITFEQLKARDEADKPTIYIAGDSTAQEYNESEYPRSGWGQKLSGFFTNGIKIDNRSMMGMSSKTFNNNGSLDAILTEMHPGDYVFIQFGINESMTDEPRYLSAADYKKLIAEKYIAETKKRGGIPVLMTPTPSGEWDEASGKFTQTHKDYAEAARELAQELGCKFIDIDRIATDAWNDLGKDEALSGYFICEPFESKVYPAGVYDTTHLNDKGATAVAGYIAEAIPECVPEFKQYLRGDEPFTDISGHWAETAILKLAEKGVVHGMGNGKFDPDGNVTRAELLKMVMDAFEIPGHAYRAGECFDVKKSDWYGCIVQSAADKGLIPPYMLGPGNTYHKITKKLSNPSDDTKTETDIYKYDFQLTSGASDKDMPESAQSFDGTKPITREEMAAVIISCMSYREKNTAADESADNNELSFADEADVDVHYAGAVKTAHALGYISGTDEGRFMPKATLTRAEAAVAVSNLAKADEAAE